MQTNTKVAGTEKNASTRMYGRFEKGRRRPPVRREAKEQQALIAWARYHPILSEKLIAIPNGGSRKDAIEGYFLKLSGVKAGVSDTFLAYKKDGYGGLWIEMKAPKPYDSPVSKAQAAWLKKMEEGGYATHVAYGWIDARDMILSYLGEDA